MFFKECAIRGDIGEVEFIGYLGYRQTGIIHQEDAPADKSLENKLLHCIATLCLHKGR